MSFLGRLIGEQIELVNRLDATRPVRIDLGQFEQLLVNLATNARDAMPSGGRLTIETYDAILDVSEIDALGLNPATREVVRLPLSDEGHGIPPEVLVHIFEPFFTTKGVREETGAALRWPTEW